MDRDLISECKAIADVMVLRHIHTCEYAVDWWYTDVDFRACVQPDKETGGYIINDGVSPISVKHYYSVPKMSTTTEFEVGGDLVDISELSLPELEVFQRSLMQMSEAVFSIKSKHERIVHILSQHQLRAGSVVRKAKSQETSSL